MRTSETDVPMSGASWCSTQLRIRDIKKSPRKFESIRTKNIQFKDLTFQSSFVNMVSESLLCGTPDHKFKDKFKDKDNRNSYLRSLLCRWLF